MNTCWDSAPQSNITKMGKWAQYIEGSNKFYFIRKPDYKGIIYLLQFDWD